MKRIVASSLALLMLISALVLSGCDETEAPIPAPDTEAPTESTPPDSDSKKEESIQNTPTTPVPLAKLSGKTPQECIPTPCSPFWMRQNLNGIRYPM